MQPVPPDDEYDEQPPAPHRQRGHHLGAYFDLPAVLGSFLMLTLGWVELTGAIGTPWHGGPAVLFWLLWGFYVIEYLVKVAISRHRLAYIRGHLLDLLTAALPFLGFLRAFKGLTGAPLSPIHFAILRQRQIGKLTIITVQVVFIAAIIELLLEQHARNSNITNWVDALYWSATTVTTVASQFAPITTGGEIVSFLLMLYAVLVFTYFMSSLASALIGGDQQGAQQGSDQQSGGGSQTAAQQQGTAAAGGAPVAAGAARAVYLSAAEVEALRAILRQVDGNGAEAGRG